MKLLLDLKSEEVHACVVSISCHDISHCQAVAKFHGGRDCIVCNCSMAVACRMADATLHHWGCAPWVIKAANTSSISCQEKWSGYS